MQIDMYNCMNTHIIFSAKHHCKIQYSLQMDLPPFCSIYLESHPAPLESTVLPWGSSSRPTPCLSACLQDRQHYSRSYQALTFFQQNSSSWVHPLRVAVLCSQLSKHHKCRCTSFKPNRGNFHLSLSPAPL